MNEGLRAHLLTWGTVALALAAAALLYWRYLEKPWTRDAQVQANVVGVAARVAGPIIAIPVKDNQTVKKGDLLFEIDPATFQAAVNEAAAKLEQAKAAGLQAKQELERQDQLYAQKVTDLQALQNAQDAYTAAVADVNATTAALETARLNLSYTTVTAPVDGYLTNVNTSPGTYVQAGQQILALVDASSFWIAGYFKETQISSIQPGDRVRLTLMGHPAQPFEGEVHSTGWGIFVDNGATVGLLPQVYQTVDWVRLPQRFPVRIHATTPPPVPFRIGQTVSASIVRD